MSTIDRTRVPGQTPSSAPPSSRASLLPGGGALTRNPPGRPGKKQNSTGAVDHWSAILFYCMGFGTVGVILVLFLVLAAVWMYGQFVWTFTRWDLADVRLKPLQPAAEFILLGAFASGFCLGLWCLSGQAWKRAQNPRPRPRAR